MKFLCDNCKAKYQIADDKVAGKTVRMKCRKCGHQIEVRAEVTESSAAPPRTPQAPRASAGKGHLATSLSAQKPKTAAGHGGALAGAFQRNVEHAPSPASFAPPPDEGISVSVTDEWYVAINGVPVGPVRISELRRKAAAGAVTDDSLCWQEGLEEWRPVRSIPELAALVREAAQQARVSLVSPGEARPSSPPKPPAPTRPAPQGTAPLAPLAPSAPVAPAPAAPVTRTEPPTRIAASAPAPVRSNVVPLHGRISVPSVSEDGPGSTSPLASPMAPHGGSAAAFAMAPTPQPTRDPFHVPAPAPAPPPPAPDPFAMPSAPMFPMHQSSPSLGPGIGYGPAEAQPSRKSGVPLWFWPVLVLALAFGGGAAFFVFRQQPPQQIVVQVPVPQAPTAPATTGKVDDVPPPPPTAEPAASTAPTTTAKVAANGGARSTSSSGGTPPKGGGAADLSGLLGGGAGGGPNVGAGGGPSGAGGGGLDQAGVERVVASHRIGVRRTCWERGSNDQKSSVNVTVSATVGPDGTVTSTSSSGDDPVVAKCIEGQVRSWRFPAPGSSTQIAIPFKFVRQ